MSLPYKIPLKSDAPTYGRSAPREEEEEQPKQQPKEQPRRSGPSRHSESTAQHGYWADIDGGGEEPEAEVKSARPQRGLGREPEIRAKGKTSAQRIKDSDDLQQELAMLLGGRRAGYAASMLEEDNPYLESTQDERYSPMGRHGEFTFSEQFTEPGDGVRGLNAEEDALIRERDRLNPYGAPTHKMRVQDAAREKIVEEWRRRGKK